jgi:hypothetical protein
MGTVTIVSTRGGFESMDFVLIVVSIVVVAFIAWQVITRTRPGRSRN